MGEDVAVIFLKNLELMEASGMEAAAGNGMEEAAAKAI